MTKSINSLDSSNPASVPSSDRPRLHIDLRDPSLVTQLKAQAAASDRTLKALVNDVLERFLVQPSVFSDQLVDNLDQLFALLDALPMEQIYQLAHTSHRSPDQMVLHLLMKGLAVYTALDEIDRD
ncbi:MAG: hypothetical protein AAFY17_07995 [Cyanobacteria bacterium J06642_11]